MADIVERLRVNSCRMAHETPDRAATRRIEAEFEAADEIERLRTQVDLLESNARIQGKLLADTARQVERLRTSALGLRYYVNNPSAWETFDDAMSERIRPVVDLALSIPSTDGGQV